jgi:hypothetical protein
MCWGWVDKLLVHHPPGVTTNLTMGVVRHVQIFVGDGVVTVSIEHWIPPITILGGAILLSVDSVCHLVYNHQLTNRRIEVWIVDGTVSFYPLFRQDWTLVLSLGLADECKGTRVTEA